MRNYRKFDYDFDSLMQYFICTEVTDGLVLKHQAISIHSADEISLVLGQFQTKILHFMSNIRNDKIAHFEKMTQVVNSFRLSDIYMCQ